MRLLGKCPSCTGCDSIFDKRREKTGLVECSVCHSKWENWYDLCSEERNRGNILVPFELWQFYGMVELCFPSRDEIALERLITGVLNTALMVRFKLRLCFACEGGVEGIVRTRGRKIYVSLLNLEDHLGLIDENAKDFRSPAQQHVVNWYADLLRSLGEDEITLGRSHLPRGEIFRLSEKEARVAFAVLWAALQKKSRSRAFATQVLGRYYDEMKHSHLSVSFLTGLTRKDIVRIYVTPPIG